MPGEISRRTVIASAAIVPVAALTAGVEAGQAQTPAPSSSALSDAQLRLLAAFVDRLIPKDELGPSASESGVPEYVNRSLADFLAAEKPAFIEGLEATDAFAHRSQDRAFVDLTPQQQDAVLTAMESGSAAGFANARVFFNRVRRLTLEGMCGDPYYGGNKDFAGWDLIKYPGPRLASTPAEQKMGVEIKPYHHSAYPSGAGSGGQGPAGEHHGH
ncbi:MAG TPA: gluconate 2-dehydrogenase subunit 3 family protein [Bryobacteraceae bacterium]|nr:gluconate 2-dehydrogenase subunit 3 family protein [Bryobacteraceae bacterium]